ncbi:general substrate transporter [Boeremia exigua]|uniref:general substrate transporter n=1 Tax=Boeremia exigua TaxID=749465 RepID=UPI001E8E4C58|nr:general substrate transporter [Boeremia exigua]KAH6613000.1 general substrate transporter [Boeremia exigua]
MVNKQLVYNWYIGLVAAGCMVLMGYDASVFNSVQVSPNWVDHFDHPNNNMIGLINTTYSVGGIIAGWFFAGPIADHLGRHWGMAIGCLMTIVVTFIQTFASRSALSAFIVGRVVIGAGQGIAITSGPIYIGEVTPSEIRGKIMAFWQLFYSVGSFVAYWINYTCARNRKAFGDWDWKIVVIFQLILPVIITLQLPFMPESPRWHISRHNNVDAARAALNRVRASHEEIEEEIRCIREAIAYEQEAAPTRWKSYLALIQDASIRKRLILVFIINIGQQLSGQGTLNSYSSTIYKKVFHSIDTINLINALNATFGILFTLNAVWTVDRFGRKFLFVVGALGMALCTMMIAVVGLATPTVDGGKTHAVGIAIAFLAFLFIFFYKPSWGATVWIYTSEVFPMHVRAQAVGMCVQMQGVANTIFQQFFPTFYANCGLKTFFFFMSSNICLAAFVWLCLPETKKVALEQMDELFGGVNHVAKGAELVEDEMTRLEVGTDKEVCDHDTKRKQ